MNYSEVVLQSPRLDRADKSSRCSERVCPCQRKWFPLSLTCFLLTSFFSCSQLETSTKIYELKLELSITLSPLRRLPCGFSWVKSGLFWKADGSLPIRLSACPHRPNPSVSWEKESFEKTSTEDYNMYTASMCKHPFRGLPWDDEGTHLGPEKRRQEVQQDSPEFLLSRPRDGSA